MNTIVLLDLEQTLIEDWSNPVLQHEANPSLLPWFKSLGDFQAGLLSFAVWNEEDLKVFNRNLREPLEQTFGFQFQNDLIFLKDDLLTRFRIWLNMPFLDQSDFSDFFNKRRSMEDLWLHEFQQPHTRLILLDDTVPNITLHSDDVENCQLQLINPLSVSFQQWG